MQAPELIHFNGQYHTQAGRSLNPAIAREIPAFGSVVAFELAEQRRERDTFPTYVSTNLTKARAGSIGSGFLPTWTTGLDLDPSTVFAAFGGDMTGANAVLAERWELLTALSKINEGQRQAMGQKAADYQTFYDDAHKLLTDARWPTVFQASADDKTPLRRRRVRARLHPGPQPAGAAGRHADGLHLRRRSLGSPLRHLRQERRVEPLPHVHAARQGPREPDARSGRHARLGARQDAARRDADRLPERVRPHARA